MPLGGRLRSRPTAAVRAELSEAAAVIGRVVLTAVDNSMVRVVAVREAILDDYYTALFTLDRGELWQAVTARPHGKVLQGYEGYYVAWRANGCHVSLPRSAGPELRQALEAEPVQAVQAVAFWETSAAARGLQLIGPSTHGYLDVDPGPVDDVVRVDEAQLASLRELVDAADWRESGWTDQPAHTFGIIEDGVLVAASNLNSFHGQPRDVGVIVAPGWRGRGLSEAVGRQASSFAIREHGFARWGARHSNIPSMAASRRLGFESWCTQVAIR